jgi:leucyl aminopeptidase
VGYLDSDIADLHSSPSQGAGAVVAALYLQEFLGAKVESWAHLDMSAPAWTDSSAGELVKGATGWGARMLIRYLASAA